MKNLALDQLPSPLLIIGGAYSGKSELAMRALQADQPAAVLGTANTQEPELRNRVNILQAQRPSRWNTYEDFDTLEPVFQESLSSPQILVDSVNQYIADALVQRAGQYSSDQLQAMVLSEIRSIANAAKQASSRVVFVSNELGSSVPPGRPLARLFRQTTGLANVQLAGLCASVVLVTAGIPTVIKQT